MNEFLQFVQATNYNLGRRGNLTKSLNYAVNLCARMGNEWNLLKYLETLPPAKALTHPSPGFDEYIAYVQKQAKNQFDFENSITRNIK